MRINTWRKWNQYWDQVNRTCRQLDSWTAGQLQCEFCCLYIYCKAISPSILPKLRLNEIDSEIKWPAHADTSWNRRRFFCASERVWGRFFVSWLQRQQHRFLKHVRSDGCLDRLRCSCPTFQWLQEMFPKGRSFEMAGDVKRSKNMVYNHLKLEGPLFHEKWMFLYTGDHWRLTFL